MEVESYPAGDPHQGEVTAKADSLALSAYLSAGTTDGLAQAMADLLALSSHPSAGTRDDQVQEKVVRSVEAVKISPAQELP